MAALRHIGGSNLCARCQKPTDSVRVKTVFAKPNHVIDAFKVTLMVAGFGLLVACADRGSSGPVVITGSTEPDSSAEDIHYLGCGPYCQEAGGYGDGGEDALEVMEVVTEGTVVTLADGTVPVKLNCLISVPCRGAVVVDFFEFGQEALPYGWAAQSDLHVPGNTTRTLGVRLSPQAMELLRSAGRVRATITADNGLIPECREIPDFAASQCEELPLNVIPGQSIDLIAPE